MEYLIVFLPLIGAIISVFFGNKFGSKYSELLTSILVGISAILSLIVFVEPTISAPLTFIFEEESIISKSRSSLSNKFISCANSL